MGQSLPFLAHNAPLLNSALSAFYTYTPLNLTWTDPIVCSCMHRLCTQASGEGHWSQNTHHNTHKSNPLNCRGFRIVWRNKICKNLNWIREPWSEKVAGGYITWYSKYYSRIGRQGGDLMALNSKHYKSSLHQHISLNAVWRFCLMICICFYHWYLDIEWLTSNCSTQ